MSQTLPDAAGASTAIKLSEGLNDLKKFADENPQVKAELLAVFGDKIAAAQKNPIASILGGAAASAFARYGVNIDPGVSTVIGLAAAILIGDVWQWVSARFFPTPVAPTK